jgi:hypothetical protein
MSQLLKQYKGYDEPEIEVNEIGSGRKSTWEKE